MNFIKSYLDKLPISKKKEVFREEDFLDLKDDNLSSSNRERQSNYLNIEENSIIQICDKSTEINLKKNNTQSN